LPIGKAEVLREGKDLIILAIGSTVRAALAAADKLLERGVKCTVVNARFVKPMDEELFCSLISEIPRLITVEENVLQGGFGSAVLEVLEQKGIYFKKIKRLGIPDTFVEHGPQDLLRAKYGLDAEGIIKAAASLL